MLERKREVFAPTDGVAYVTTDVEPARGEDYSDATLYGRLYSLAARRMRVTTRDVELADASGCEITAKLEVRSAPGLSPNDTVIYDGHVFDLTRVESRGHTSWLWLSEVATDGMCALVPEGAALDSHGIPMVGGTEPVSVYCRKVSRGYIRTVPQGTDQLRPSLALRLRAIDYRGETRVTRCGITYTITKVDGSGRWIDLTCERKVADL